MNQNIFHGKWEDVKWQMKKTWNKLTDADMKDIEGNQQEIYTKLQKHYGYTKEQIKKELDSFQNQSRH